MSSPKPKVLVDPDRVEKRIGQNALERLQSLTVAIIGLGSLGSETTMLLAKNMIGNFVLIDADTLSEHNITRHLLDTRHVGWPKVEAMKEQILFRNPLANVVAIQDYAQNALDTLKGVDLVIVAGLGSEIAQQEIGGMLRKMKLPVLFGGVYERGAAGEVLFVHPTDGPCYSCFASILRDAVDTHTSQKVNYGMPFDEVKAEPGLGMHITRVAAALADWALRLLIDDEEVMKQFDHNLVILANERFQIGTRGDKPVYIEPQSAWWTTIEQNEHCLVCSLGDELHETDTLSDLLE